jgi:hypothetical protein
MTNRKVDEKHHPDPDELTEEELEEADGEPLPDREAMSTIRPLPGPVTLEPPIDWE